MIRPSALAITENCTLSHVLGKQFPTKNENTDRGNFVDAQVTAWVNDGTKPSDDDASACCGWLTNEFPTSDWTMHSQVRVQPQDPDTGGAICGDGTLDIVARHRRERLVVVVDIKKREQYLAGRLAEADVNLQLGAYALGCVGPSDSYRVCLLLFGAGAVEPLWSDTYTSDTWQPMLQRIQGINERAMTTEPIATTGPHCNGCYQRLNCPGWVLPAHQGETALEPFTKPGGLTQDNIGKAVMIAGAMKEIADRALKHARTVASDQGWSIQHGGREYREVRMPGRVSVDQCALEKAGLLERFSRVGADFPQWRWTKVGAK